ncbi:MAG: GGDEF domain-containing protein [Herminiimonas sp.]|nr:GGDEF domain-containing protein [Herminiimonas sp.]
MVALSCVQLGTHAKNGDCRFGRLGGEEFAMLLATTSERDAVDMAERLRAEVKCIERPDSVLSTSIGIAHTQPGETITSLLQRADNAMLLAKRKGRDRVEWA